MRKLVSKFGIVAFGIFAMVSCSKNEGMPPQTNTGGNNNTKTTITAGQSFTDSRDGTVYPTVKINNQTWMTKNLSFKLDGKSWAYDNKESNVAKYGRLYTWDGVKDAIPAGWHLPTDAEWQTLEKALGMTTADLTKTGYDVARGNGIGTKLKANGESKLDFPIAGFAEIDGTNVTFEALENRTYLWINTTVSGGVYRRRLPKADSNVYRFTNPSAGFAISVRLVKD